MSLDQTAYAFAQAAARAGMSTSAWLSAAAPGGGAIGRGQRLGDPHADALADNAELAAAEAEQRATG